MLNKLLSVAALALFAVETSAVTISTESLAMHEDAPAEAEPEVDAGE